MAATRKRKARPVEYAHGAGTAQELAGSKVRRFDDHGDDPFMHYFTVFPDDENSAINYVASGEPITGNMIASAFRAQERQIKRLQEQVKELQMSTFARVRRALSRLLYRQ